VRPGYSSGASSNFDESEAGSDAGSAGGGGAGSTRSLRGLGGLKRLGGSARSLGSGKGKGGGSSRSVGGDENAEAGKNDMDASHHSTKNNKEYVSVIHRTGSHPDLLALGTLRQTIMDQGGLAEALVRIATPFGKPIEEIYDGVHDGPILGSGVSGLVRLICHRATGTKYAVKILDLGA
jgi:hypothetical protein